MNDKELVAIEAAKRVKNGMVVGLGTGSTANYFIEHLAKRQAEGGLNISTVASSTISAMKAESCGLKVVSIAQLKRIDLYVDGADEITPNLSLLKGRGQDLVMEKLLAKAADQFIVVADKSKLVSRIGEKFIIPIEVIPSAWQMVKHQLEKQGAQGDIRLNAGKDNVVISAHGSYVLDMQFPVKINDEALNNLLNNTPGIVEHGVFYGIASQVLIADNGIIEVMGAQKPL
ncbi:MAG: ribose-5-phosphate isomerase RpiA [Candidatus Methylopumilus sp.]|jgi:ribose 5-phosphate isomerase A|nr:ribose-5-phosphate isomerase RpiA [Candidatus Methylopumilus sp.]